MRRFPPHRDTILANPVMVAFLLGGTPTLLLDAREAAVRRNAPQSVVDTLEQAASALTEAIQALSEHASDDDRIALTSVLAIAVDGPAWPDDEQEQAVRNMLELALAGAFDPDPGPKASRRDAPDSSSLHLFTRRNRRE